MTYILVIWTVVAIHGSQYGSTTDVRYDWRPIGEFKNARACEHSGRALRAANQFRCLPTDTAKQ